jgi:hypothetical protein
MRPVGLTAADRLKAKFSSYLLNGGRRSGHEVPSFLKLARPLLKQSVVCSDKDWWLDKLIYVITADN